jgi:hypothetical protein
MIIEFPHGRTRPQTPVTGESELRAQIRQQLASVVGHYIENPDAVTTLAAIERLNEAVELIRAHWELQHGGAPC